MKKFSWIFALILALSIGFIGCPTDPVTTKKTDDNNNNSSSGGQFGTGDGQIAVLKDGKNGDTNIDPGILTYLADGSGFKYTYGQGGNAEDKDWNYGNSVLRFKIDLGDNEDGDPITLDDYGFVTFDWQADGPYKTDVNDSKKLWLLVSADEADLKPYLNDTKEADDNTANSYGVKRSIVSSTYFDTNTGKKMWDDTDAPSVNGLGKVTIQLPILKKGMLGGEVWFAIYVHASGGSYTISNFKLGGDPSYVNPGPGQGAPSLPPVPADIPADYVEIALDLSVSNVSDVSGYGDADTAINTLPVLTAVTPAGVKAEFKAGNNQRLNVKLSTADKAKFNANNKKQDIYVQMDYEINDGAAGDLFRYHVGIISSGDNFNVTDSLADNFSLDKIAINASGKGIKLAGTNKATRAADYFILQHRNDTEITVTIKKISLWVAPVSVVPEKTMTFATGDVVAIGSTTLDSTTTSGYSYTTTGYGQACYFKVKFADGFTLSDYSGVNFTVSDYSGDITYKRFKIAVFADAPSAITEDDQKCLTETAGNANPGTAGAAVGGDPIAMTFSFDQPAKITSAIDKQEVYVVIFVWSDAAEWTISDITFF
jgi:hypothetical protein